MGYSTSPKTLDERIDWLQPIREGREAHWTVERGKEAANAYRIREALWIAENICPERYPELAHAHTEYEIVAQRGTRKIFARKAAVAATLILVESVEPLEGSVDATPDPPAVAVRVQRAEIKGAQTRFSIVESVRAHPGHTLHFPEAGLKSDALAALWRWTEANGLLLVVHEKALTVLPYDPRIEPAAWRPDAQG